MKATSSKYKISILDAEHTIVNHMLKLKQLTHSTIQMHEKAIQGLFSSCIEEGRGGEQFLCLSQSNMVRWMASEVKNKSTKYAAKLFQAANRYLCELCHIGLTSVNQLEQLKIECGNRSWECIAETLKSPNPSTRLKKLRDYKPLVGPLHPYIASYKELNQSLGKHCRDCQYVLTSFDVFLASRFKGSAKSIVSEHIQCWIDAMKCSVKTKRRKIHVLKRFFDYLVAIDFLAKNPAAVILLEFGSPAKVSFKPFIFTKSQITKILVEAKHLPKTHKFPLRAETVYTMIALVYALGLRNREVRNLRLHNVDLNNCILFIEKTKFNKSRLTPFGPKVAKCIREYLKIRGTLFAPMEEDDPLFITYRKRPICSSTLDDTFRNIVQATGIHDGSKKNGPRLHDLRHSFAVHRLLQWYKEQADVQSKLLQLSVFMGHTEIRSTEVYLTITVELLREANKRFYQTFGTMFDKEPFNEK